MSKNKNDQSQKNLSDAADTMRNSSNREERSEAAKTMGKAGGSQSQGGGKSSPSKTQNKRDNK